MAARLIRVCVYLIAIHLNFGFWASDLVADDPELPKEPSTHLEYCQQEFAYFQPLVKLYGETTADTHEMQAEVEKYLETCLRKASGLGNVPTREKLIEQGAELLKSGTDSPFVKMYHAQELLAEGHWIEARELVEAANQEIAKPPYLPQHRVLCCDLLWHTQLCFSTEARAAAAQQLFDALVEWITTDADEENQRILYAKYVAAKNRQYDDEVKFAAARKIIDSPGTNPWTKEMVQGLLARDEAWKSRGTGFANEVTEDGWKGFEEKMPLSAKHFEAAWRLKPEFPEAAGELVSVAMAGYSDRSTDEWFELAIKAQIDYSLAYHNYRWSKHERWGGNNNELFLLAYRWINAGRFDTNQPYMGIEALKNIGSELKDNMEFVKDDTARKLYRTALEGLAADPLHAPSVRSVDSRNDLLTEWGAIAMKFNYDQEAFDTFQKLGDDWNPRILRSWGYNGHFAIHRLYARIGPAADDLSEFSALEEFEQSGSKENALRSVAVYEKAKKLTANPRADAYFANWMTVYGKIADYHDGKWVNLNFPATLVNFAPPRGFWTVEDDATIVSRETVYQSGPWLMHDGNYAGPLEVEVDIEILEATGPIFGTGIIIGNPWNKTGLYFWINHLTQQCGATTEKNCEGGQPIPEGNRFVMSIKAWPGRYEMYLDGKLVLSEQNEQFLSDGRLGLGGIRDVFHKATVRYRNFRVRKIAEPEQPAVENETVENETVENETVENETVENETADAES
jgi:hypothetical protein